MVGGDHGDAVFQFGAMYLSSFVMETCIIEFEVSACKLICRKDAAKIIESTILPRLTAGLLVVATYPFTYTKKSTETSFASSAKHVQPPNTLPRQFQR